MGNEQNVRAAILAAFSKLILEYGYRGATTKKIAAVAKINESTVFRHFKNKQGILEQLVANYLHDVKRVTSEFQSSGDVEYDLVQCAKIYREFTVQHKPIFLLSLHEADQFLEIAQAAKQFPQYFRRALIKQFQEMKDNGKINSSVTVEVEADNFFELCFGNTVASFAYPNSELYISRDDFLNQNVRAFASHLK